MVVVSSFVLFFVFFFFKQKTAYEMRISDWSSDVCSSDLVDRLLLEESTVWLIDYKSQRPAPTESADVPIVYLRQMAAYRALLARIYPGREVRCFLLWTDGPRLMQLSDALLAGHAP